MKQSLSERVWIFAAGICLVCAVVFLVRENMSAAFVAATLGVVAWFLNVRNQLKRNIIPRDEEIADETDDESDDESDAIKDVEKS